MSKRHKKINHGRVKPKYNPRPNKAQREYHDHIRGLGCLVCGRPPSVHHITSDGYKRLTKDHWLVVPLCWEHHQGDKGYHGLGSHDKFVEMYKIDLFEKAKEFRDERNW